MYGSLTDEPDHASTSCSPFPCGPLSRLTTKHHIRAEMFDFFSEYETERVVVVQSKMLGISYRLFQLVIIAYFVGWVFIYEKGYQCKSDLISSVNIKLKGIALIDVHNLGPQLLDDADYVFPTQGDSSFVVMTNFIVTPNQMQGTCAELPDKHSCNNDTDCIRGETSPPRHGVMTGRCIPYNNKIKTCEVDAWCPVENDTNTPNPAMLLKAENFTLLIKNSISFPEFNVTRRNLVESVTNDYLENCNYHTETDPLCPIFRLGYIVSESRQQFASLALEGGTLGIIIEWQCDLDWDIKFCKPIYRFVRLDNPQYRVSKGFNFRYARYYTENNVTRRNLYKIFGIRFDVMVSGEAGKFDIIPTMTTIGSGIGIFGVATLVCDLMLLHVIPKRKYYKQKKFKCAQQTDKDDSNLACNNFQKDNEENVKSESSAAK
ncbi:P2X purinoceptor 1-like isoform X1 [Pleurodeles waltl]|uniref:P2X purinoceptor 1-like isoform X1 n=1 Tax=Pleurodeles waltl TaxID=8319 RepID=UPI0037094CF7